jgi:hypothetical protein
MFLGSPSENTLDIIYKKISQGNFCKILKFVIGHVIKYSQLVWKRIQHYNVMYNIFKHENCVHSFHV